MHAECQYHMANLDPISKNILGTQPLTIKRNTTSLLQSFNKRNQNIESLYPTYEDIPKVLTETLVPSSQQKTPHLPKPTLVVNIEKEQGQHNYVLSMMIMQKHAKRTFI